MRRLPLDSYTELARVLLEDPDVFVLITGVASERPDLVKRVLADAVRKRSPIAVFEPLERSIRMMTLVGLISFLRGYSHTHRVGQLTPARVLLTYVLPVSQAMFAWDGSISTLRTYTADELLALARSVTIAGYEWDAGRFDVDGPYGSMPTTYTSPSSASGTR